MTQRKKTSKEIEKKVLVRSQRRCCLCFGLESDFDRKKGQIAHLDKDPSNNALDNLAWLCWDHHDEYDSITSQSKGLTIEEVKEYRDLLHQAVSERRKAKWPGRKDPIRRVQIYLQGDLSSLPPDRRSAVIDALAGLLKISTQAIEVYSVYEGSVVFDLGLPLTAFQRLGSLLRANNAQLRLLGIERVILENEPGEIEEWVVEEGWFSLVDVSVHPEREQREGARRERIRLDFIAKLPNWIAGFIALVTAVVGFTKLWQGDTDLVTTVLLAVGVGGGTLGCAYWAFKRTPPLVEGGKGTWQYQHWRPWALVSMITISLLTASGVGYYLYLQAQFPTKAILLVTDFDGPEPEKYRVTETVLASLRAALEPYDDVQVEALGRTITEAEGSTTARVEGEKRKASIVIWGWYGATAEAVPLSVHFELLRPPEYMPELGPEAKGLVQTMAMAELESFTLQTRLSGEMAYLSLFTVGMARYAAEDWDGAIARFSDALSQTVERVPALDQSIVHRKRGVAYHYKGDYDHAIADYDQAIQLQPGDTLAYYDRGVAYVLKGDLDRAIADFEQAIQLQANYADAYVGRGRAYADKGDYDRAIADYDQAIQLQPDLAVAYNNRGNAYDVKGDLDRAIADFNQAIELQPDYADAYNNRGVAYYHTGDLNRAIADYDRAIQLQSDNAMAYSNRGAAYAAKGDTDRAIADFDQAIQLQPDWADAYYNRGNAYLAKGDTDRAIADFDQAIQLQHGYASAYIGRGRAYVAKGDLDRAIADYDQAIRLRPDLARAYNYRGNAYADKDDYDQAIADYDQAIQLQPDAPEVYYNRGLAYMEKGEKEKAIADFNKFLDLSNDPYWRQQAEEQLKALEAK